LVSLLALVKLALDLRNPGLAQLHGLGPMEAREPQVSRLTRQPNHSVSFSPVYILKNQRIAGKPPMKDVLPAEPANVRSLWSCIKNNADLSDPPAIRDRQSPALKSNLIVGLVDVLPKTLR
jgi:hypothetical protein